LLLFNSAIDGGEWSASRSCRFTSEESTHWIPKPVWTLWRRAKSLAIAGSRTSGVQSLYGLSYPATRKLATLSERQNCAGGCLFPLHCRQTATGVAGAVAGTEPQAHRERCPGRGILVCEVQMSCPSVRHTSGRQPVCSARSPVWRFRYPITCLKRFHKLHPVSVDTTTYISATQYNHINYLLN
jgi:hypothetical protein